MYDASQQLTGAGARLRSLPEWPDTRPLRSWQQEATEAVRAHTATSFLASATPAAGKTTFGLHIAHRMLSAGFVSRLVVVGPTTHISRQWAADAGRYEAHQILGYISPLTPRSSLLLAQHSSCLHAPQQA